MIVRKLIADKFGVNLSITAVGKLLARLGLTPQKPLKRAYERDPIAIEAWKSQVFPRLAKRGCQSASKIDPLSASNFDPQARGSKPLASAPSGSAVASERLAVIRR